MLKLLKISGFKALNSVKIQFAPRVTILIGANGSGKSSIFQSLLLVKQSIGNAALNQQGLYLKFVDANEHLHKKLAGSKFTFQIEGTTEIRSPIGKSDYRAELVFRDNVLIGQRVEVTSFKLGMGIERNLNQLKGGESIDSVEFNVELVPGVPGALKFTPATDNAQKHEAWQSGAVTEWGTAVARGLNEIGYVSPFRGILEPVESLADDAPPHLSRPWDYANTFMYKREELEEKVSNWLQSVTGTKIKPALKQRREIALETTSLGTTVNLMSDGSGTNQLATLLIHLARVGNDSTLIIEEPETHLHPKAQSNLVKKVLADVSKNTQLIITTHSEHILNSFLNLVARGEMKQSDVGLWYASKSEKGETLLKQIAIQKNGMVEGEIPGFFEATVDEMKDLIEGIKKSAD